LLAGQSPPVRQTKKRDIDLAKHHRQAFEYWTRLVPNRPRYVVLCNFDEFWVFDFETQMDAPVDLLKLAELPQRWGPLAFLFAKPETPVFQFDHEQVTRAAADLLATLYNHLVGRGREPALAQRFVLQSLMCLFAEDIGLLDKYFFARLLDDCTTPEQSFDLIGALFVEMNTPGKNAAAFDWRYVRPEIFGTIFEHLLGSIQRHAFGAHFTSPADIMKIVGPTIVAPWREQIESAKTLKRLEELLARLENLRVLDPACGSGNFPYIAYRELKRLEARIYERMGEFASRNAAQRPFGFVTSKNFHGMDIEPFAVELAKVTMMLAHKLAIDELHVNENALPLDNLDANFSVGDALVQADGTRPAWPKVDVIIGNPPFIGTKLLKPLLGADYVNAVRRAYPEVPGMADYCDWFRRAHDHLPPCTAQDPVAGRAGLVGTENIRNGASRIGGLDAICADGKIIDAVDNQPWSGEANVHVSIANWVKTQEPALLPKTRRLWFKTAQRGAKDYDLDCREVAQINSALSDAVDLGKAAILECNRKPQRVFQGVTPGHASFVLDAASSAALGAGDSKSRELIYPYIIGDEILSGASGQTRFIPDFEQRNIIEAQAYPAAFAHVQTTVLPARQAATEAGKDAAGNIRSHHKAFLDRWWQLSWGRADMVAQLAKPPRYLACSRVTKRPIFAFINAAVRPGDALQVFAFADNYSFGILQSSTHWQWFVAKCSKLTERLRYTPESVFDTFPWPQAPSEKQIDAIAAAGREIRRIRSAAPANLSGGLRALYRTLDQPGKNPLRDAHVALDAAVLDAAVLAAYGFSAKADLLEQLLALNTQVAQRLSDLQPVTAPGIPACYSKPEALLSGDCLGATPNGQ